MLRKSFVLPVLLPVLLLSACRSGNETLEKQNAEILAEMKRINARLDVVEKQTKQNAGISPELNKINAKLDALDKQIKQARTASQNDVPGPVPANLNKLSKIRPLPADPTDQQIIEYIRQIHEATRGQTIYSSNDPQVTLFERIGPGHYRLLRSYLRRNRIGQGLHHLRYALPRLIDERDKELLRQTLDDPIMIDIVAEKGWLKEMKKDILAVLKSANRAPIYGISRYLPELVESPEDLKIITDAYIHSRAGEGLLSGLKKIPGVDIRKLVNQAWAEAQKNPNCDYVNARISRAQHVIQYGGPNVEAVKYLLKRLMAEPSGTQTFLKQQIIPFLLVRCDFPVYDPARLREWYDKNADRIVYDPATGKYVVKK